MDILLKDINELYNRNKHIKSLVDLINKPGELNKLDKPVMIHVIGQETSSKLQRSYICTALRQIETANKLGITNDRIYIIYGDALPKNENDRTCKFTKDQVAKHHWRKKLPDNVNITYVPQEGNFDDVLTNILKNKCTEKTPIIFGYDGHGEGYYGFNADTAGNMTIYNGAHMTNQSITTIFTETKRINNNKFFLWTQCGSYYFITRIEAENVLLGFHIVGTNKDTADACSAVGSSVMREFSWKLLKIQFGEKYTKGASKYELPPDLKDLTFETYKPKKNFYSILLPKSIDPKTKIHEYLNLSLL